MDAGSGDEQMALIHGTLRSVDGYARAESRQDPSFRIISYTDALIAELE